MDNPLTLCLRCAGEGRTCCQGTSIVLTGGDVGRIEAWGGGEFWERRRLSPEGGGADRDEVWGRVFCLEGGVRVLRHRANGDCWFLGGGGCELPVGVRPLVCRLYPYEYDGGTIKGVTAHLCPEPERGNVSFLLACLGMNRVEAEGWRKDFYRELGEDLLS